MNQAATPLVGVVMGSDSDWNVMREASELLDEFGVAHEVEVVSAHRTPEKMIAYGKEAAGRGLKVIIAGAGGAAHLPGMLASVTTLPVVGVPVPLSRLDGLDSLLSIVQMPAGVPVATVSIGGARNAGLVAVKEGATAAPRRIRVVEAGHPLPDERGRAAADEIRRLVGTAGPDGLVLCLVSGGGSALLPAPVAGVSLAEKQAVTRLLLDAGATINELNAVRKHLSLLKGGGFGRVIAYIWAIIAIVNSFMIIDIAPWFAVSTMVLAGFVIYGLAMNPEEGEGL